MISFINLVGKIATIPQFIVDKHYGVKQALLQIVHISKTDQMPICREVKESEEIDHI